MSAFASPSRDSLSLASFDGRLRLFDVRTVFGFGAGDDGRSAADAGVGAAPTGPENAGENVDPPPNEAEVQPNLGAVRMVLR